MSDLIYKIVENEQELRGSDEVRRQVFSGEQGIAEELVFENSGSDGAFDVIVKDGETVIGTARVAFPEENAAKIERMAVLPQYRRKGVGQNILSFLHEELKSRGIIRVILHAQFQVADFYTSCGFKKIGPPFAEAGIKHIKMELNYPDSPPKEKSRIQEIEEKIADLKARWPTHSVPPHMWQQLEELEEELEKARKDADTNESH